MEYSRANPFRLLPVIVAFIVAVVALGVDMPFQAKATTEPVKTEGANAPVGSDDAADVDLDSLYQAKTAEMSGLDSTSVAAVDPTRTIDGHVSWYGGRFHGRRTANGERFDMNEMTAAHKTLPFNTLVRVVDTRTDNAVLVRINDRGPYVGGRVLDLSREAADRLGMRSRGTTSGRLEIYRPAPRNVGATDSMEATQDVEFVTFDASLKGVECNGWTVAVRETMSFESAVNLHDALAHHYEDVYLTQVVRDGETSYVVSVGLYGSMRFCRDLNVELRTDYPEAVIAHFSDGFPEVQDDVYAFDAETTLPSNGL
jgi:rare lipoprotein A